MIAKARRNLLDTSIGAPAGAAVRVIERKGVDLTCPQAGESHLPISACHVYRKVGFGLWLPLAHYTRDCTDEHPYAEEDCHDDR
jgi:hypothetical protein